MLDLKALLAKILSSVKPYLLNSTNIWATRPPIKFAEYDSGLKTLAASTVTNVDATMSNVPTGYTGYIIRCRIQNGSGGVNESGCNPYNFYFQSGTVLRANVRNSFSSQAKVHVLFTVIWVNPNMLS